MTFGELQRAVRDLHAQNIDPLTDVCVFDPATNSRTDVAGAFLDRGRINIALEYYHPDEVEDME